MPQRITFLTKCRQVFLAFSSREFRVGNVNAQLLWVSAILTDNLYKSEIYVFCSKAVHLLISALSVFGESEPLS